MLTDKKENTSDTIINVCGINIGNGFCVMAGPCTVESAQQLSTIAQGVKACGAQILRGGAFKLRTSPYSFQGLGLEGLDLLIKTGQEQHMPIVTELPSIEYALEFAQKADIIQIGARNMQNVPLLLAAAATQKPILLKRGSGNTIDELLLSAEYIMAAGNKQVILCERGIRTFENATRFTLDLGAVPVLKRKTHLPVIVDPSHAMGDHRFVSSMSLAALTAGADGILVEVHNEPQKALCDAAQALDLIEFSELMQKIRKIQSVL